MKISDFIGIRKGLGKITQSLKKMTETMSLMHSKFELNLAQCDFNSCTCCVFYGGWGIQGNKNNEICALSRSCGPNCISWNIEDFCLRVSMGVIIMVLHHYKCF